MAYALLLTIAYGALVEAVHSHGRVLPSSSEHAAVCDRDGSRSSADSNSHQRDCSMCQFQRHLFDGFVHATTLARTSLSQVAFASALTVSYQSTSTKPRSGRAPPLS